MKSMTVAIMLSCVYLLACSHGPKDHINADKTKEEKHKNILVNKVKTSRQTNTTKTELLVDTVESLVSTKNRSKDKKTRSSEPKPVKPKVALKTDTTQETTVEKPSKDSLAISIQSIDSTHQTKVQEVVQIHQQFDELLRKYVSTSGIVNYEGFKTNKTTLKSYVESLQKNNPQSSWSKEKEMAYWINLYNAFTILSIVEKYPVKSILDLEGGNIWDNKKLIVGGKSLTLNMIEKEQLLKRFKEPRVHFAVNCAAASCPPLLNKAWTEDNIKSYFSKQAKAFINNSKFNKISTNAVEVSQIFNWYADDFGGKSKLIEFLNKYAAVKISSSASIKFIEYDWKLNNK